MHKILIFIALIAVAAYGCTSSGSSGETIDKACTYFDEGRYNRARTSVDSLMNDSAQFNELSVGSLCRLALLCLRLDSGDGSSKEHVAYIGDALAARCLTRAQEIDADSVDRFIRSLPREQASRLDVINSVSTYLSIPRDSLVVESDTIQ